MISNGYLFSEEIIDRAARLWELRNVQITLDGTEKVYNETKAYIAPKDNATNYYFDILAKGEHVVETEYYVDREGEYTSGICTVQCAYAPEYSGRDAAFKIVVK